MRIPDDAVIPWEKLTRYLLLPRPRNDKSGFLAQAGFGADNPEKLLRALRELAAGGEALEDEGNEYGTFLRLDGDLTGPNGRALRVATIWLRWHLDGSVHFVTLKPGRRDGDEL